VRAHPRSRPARGGRERASTGAHRLVQGVGGPIRAEHRGDRAARQGGRLEHRLAERARVVACVADLRLRVGEVERLERHEPEGEAKPHAVERRLRGQVAQLDVEAAPRVLVIAEPPVLVGESDGQA
jgi:hypothetical protein